jgi:FkbM family methyltransferase
MLENSFSRRIRRKYRSYLISYLKRKNIILKSDFGFRINLDVTKDVDKNFYLDLFELENLNLFHQLVSDDNIIFDVGANIGIYSLTAASTMSASTRIFAFEPADGAYQRLLANIDLNNFGNIMPFKLAIGDRKGNASFYVCDDDAYNSIIDNTMRPVLNIEKVELCTIDNFCQSNHIDRIDLLKIDAEGADYLILIGAMNILSQPTAPIIFCEYNRNIVNEINFRLSDLLDFIRELKYDIYEISNGKLIKVKNLENISEIICFKDYHLEKINSSLLS